MCVCVCVLEALLPLQTCPQMMFPVKRGVSVFPSDFSRCFCNRTTCDRRKGRELEIERW